MNIMIIGGGGREHALAWKVSRSPSVSNIYCVPGNAGISEVAECIPGDVSDYEGLAKLAKEKRVDITIVGPEAPLSLGIVDEFKDMGLSVFGPSKEAAQIESSRVNELQNQPDGSNKIEDEQKKERRPPLRRRSGRGGKQPAQEQKKFEDPEKGNIIDVTR